MSKDIRTVGGNCVWIGDEQIAVCGFSNIQDARVADKWAAHIVACLKACEGISYQTLQRWLNPPKGQLGAPHGTWAAQLSAAGNELVMMQKRVDTLLEAIRNHKKVKGRFHTEQATLELYRLLEEMEGA